MNYNDVLLLLMIFFFSVFPDFRWDSRNTKQDNCEGYCLFVYFPIHKSCMHFKFSGEMIHGQGENSVKMIFGFPLKRGLSKRKEFAPPWSKFFPFRKDPFSVEAWCAEKQSGSHKSCLPAEILPSVFVSLSNVRFYQPLSYGFYVIIEKNLKYSNITCFFSLYANQCNIQS